MTCIHERADGGKIEYRLADESPFGVFDLEYRRLRREDGTPYKDFWHPVGDKQLVKLQKSGTDIIDMLIDPETWAIETS